MGGKLTVSSQVGKGSTFSFELPVGLVEATAIPTQPPTHRVIALEPNQPQFCLLIADDNRDNRQLLVQLLSPLGFEVREASNDREAVEIWQSFAPHLIWMDIQMPVMNGYEATQRIRAMGSRGNVGARGRGDAGTRRREEISDSQFPIPKIIALTASISELERDIALNAGCDDFIGKPFRESDIFEAMHQHLGVRYVYEQFTPPEATQTELVILNREILAVLPTHWLAEFHQATTEGDFEWMLTLIEQIREQHGPIAQALASLTNQLQFEQLLALTETGTPT
jgi:CheY-like chemotaxis protein